MSVVLMFSPEQKFQSSKWWCMSCVQFVCVCVRVLSVCLCMTESQWQGCSWGRRSSTMTEWGRPTAEWHAHHVSLLLHRHTQPHIHTQKQQQQQQHTKHIMATNKSAWILLKPLAVNHCPTIKNTHKTQRRACMATQNGDVITPVV